MYIRYWKWWTLFLEVSANDGVKPSLLVRHLKTKHPKHEDKYLHFFSMMLKSCCTQSKTLQDFTKLSDRSLKPLLRFLSSRRQRYCWGNTSSSCGSRNVYLLILCGKECGDKLKHILLSADTVGRCLENIAKVLKKQIH